MKANRTTFNYASKAIILTSIVGASLLSSCTKREQCPAYAGAHKYKKYHASADDVTKVNHHEIKI